MFIQNPKIDKMMDNTSYISSRAIEDELMRKVARNDRMIIAYIWGGETRDERVRSSPWGLIMSLYRGSVSRLLRVRKGSH